MRYAGKWDCHFIRMCFLVSEMSKDPSTKCGAVLVRPDKTVCSTGFNGFPKSFDDDSAFYEDRERKYEDIIHAEMNALIHSRDSNHHGYTLYTTPMLPCWRCSPHLLEAGITRFVSVKPSQEREERWKMDFCRRQIEKGGAKWVELDTERVYHSVGPGSRRPVWAIASESV